MYDNEIKTKKCKSIDLQSNKSCLICYNYVHLRTVFFMVLNLGYEDWLSGDNQSFFVCVIMFNNIFLTNKMDCFFVYRKEIVLRER